MAQRYFLSVNGLSDGFSFYGAGDVFVGSERVCELFDATAGKDVDGPDPERLLFEESDRAAYDKFLAIQQGSYDVASTAEANGVAGPITLLDNEGEELDGGAEAEAEAEAPAKAPAKAKASSK